MFNITLDFTHDLSRDLYTENCVSPSMYCYLNLISYYFSNVEKKSTKESKSLSSSYAWEKFNVSWQPVLFYQARNGHLRTVSSKWYHEDFEALHELKINIVVSLFSEGWVFFIDKEVITPEPSYLCTGVQEISNNFLPQKSILWIFLVCAKSRNCLQLSSANLHLGLPLGKALSLVLCWLEDQYVILADIKELYSLAQAETELFWLYSNWRVPGSLFKINVLILK